VTKQLDGEDDDDDDFDAKGQNGKDDSFDDDFDQEESEDKGEIDLDAYLKWKKEHPESE
jgi:hypothetical protein